MPLTKHLRQAESLNVKGNAMPIAERFELSERSDLCVPSGLCRSRLCPFTNTGCLGSKKGN
jgi:hypothetical protein